MTRCNVARITLGSTMESLSMPNGASMPKQLKELAYLLNRNSGEG